MYEPIPIKELENIKAYVDWAEKNGRESQVRHLRLLLNEVDALRATLMRNIA